MLWFGCRISLKMLRSNHQSLMIEVQRLEVAARCDDTVQQYTRSDRQKHEGDPNRRHGYLVEQGALMRAGGQATKDALM